MQWSVIDCESCWLSLDLFLYYSDRSNTGLLLVFWFSMTSFGNKRPVQKYPSLPTTIERVQNWPIDSIDRDRHCLTGGVSMFVLSIHKEHSVLWNIDLNMQAKGKVGNLQTTLTQEEVEGTNMPIAKNPWVWIFFMKSYWRSWCHIKFSCKVVSKLDSVWLSLHVS